MPASTTDDKNTPAKAAPAKAAASSAPSTPPADPPPAPPEPKADAAICRQCWPNGWPANTTTAGCAHGNWTRTTDE